ncbi:hypothetical protein BC830DRAFT_662788 [Chytriomyces sp. MP71]|nr:hypothetical protein BC830DRAFT_662788 [Chytriomyces sp. MP71]
MMMNLGGGGTGGGDPLQPGTAPAKAKRRRNRMALVCAQCRALKAKCDQTKPACAACLRKGVPCEYVSRHTPKEEAAKARRPRGHTGSTLASLSQPSASRSPSAASPSVIAFNPNPALALVDADLMPTIQDWFLIFNYLAVDENLPLLVSIAAERILDNFFFESPALRLTLCTIAAHMQYPRLSARVCASYYSRAKKAILQSIPHPSVKTLKSLLLFSQFALGECHGRPVEFSWNKGGAISINAKGNRTIWKCIIEDYTLNYT